ncbi:MAG TPA: hypothetical protein VHG53_01960 [Candidatus Limnocylindria bacterium]|nr:hypothetical protein [Candidatus Limnocylindria bacterium]
MRVPEWRGDDRPIDPPALAARDVFQRRRAVGKTPEVQGHLQRRLEQLDALGRIATERAVLVIHEPGSESNNEAPAKQLIEEVARLHEPERLMDRGIDGREDDVRTRDPLGDRRREQQRVLIWIVRAQVMFGQDDRVETRGVGQGCLLGQETDERKLITRIVRAWAEVQRTAHPTSPLRA